jgi:hypothetical protein
VQAGDRFDILTMTSRPTVQLSFAFLHAVSSIFY